MTRVTTRTATPEIAARRDFTTSGALSGRNITHRPWGGHLPQGWVDRLTEENPTYVVESYSTPIAWWSEDHGWTFPAVRYSVTTSRHQGQVARATGVDPTPLEEAP